MSDNGAGAAMIARIARLRARLAEAFARRRARLAEAFARRRVALGFVFGAAAFALAQPSARSIAFGMSVALVGESLRVWAAGHLNKAREVTSSGPYRWFAHPLYVGSSIMGAGLALACASVPVAVLIATYLSVTLTVAIRNEEKFLRRAFGEHYERYRQGGGITIDRPAGRAKRFSLTHAIGNREHRAVVGLLIAVLLLVWKATYNGTFWR